MKVKYDDEQRPMAAASFWLSHLPFAFCHLPFAMLLSFARAAAQIVNRRAPEGSLAPQPPADPRRSISRGGVPVARWQDTRDGRVIETPLPELQNVRGVGRAGMSVLSHAPVQPSGRDREPRSDRGVSARKSPCRARALSPARVLEHDPDKPCWRR